MTRAKQLFCASCAVTFMMAGYGLSGAETTAFSPATGQASTAASTGPLVRVVAFLPHANTSGKSSTVIQSIACRITGAACQKDRQCCSGMCCPGNACGACD